MIRQTVLQVALISASTVVGVQLRNNLEMDVRMVNSFLVFTGII